MIAGLTGGIATGKSTVAARLRTLGATVVDADEVSREVVAPGTVALQSIRKAFGDGILHVDGRLNREALGNIVRVDSAARKQLESITHHHIRAEIAKRVQDAVIAGAPSVFVEASTERYADDLVGQDMSDRQYAARVLRRRVRTAWRIAGRNGETLQTVEARQSLATFDALVAPR